MTTTDRVLQSLDQPEGHRERRRLGPGNRAVAVAGAVSAALLLGGCSNDNLVSGPSPSASVSSAASAAGAAGATPSTSPPTGSATSPAASPGQPFRIGDTVTVAGRVTDDLSALSFELQPDDGRPALPVLTVRDASVGTGDQVTVEGRIAKFDAQSLQQDLPIKLDEDLVQRYSGKQVLIAQVVNKR